MVTTELSTLLYSLRVAIITNSVTGVVIALATASIGAVFSSTATDMGTSGILERYRQIRPKILFASCETVYAGKTINIARKIGDVEHDLRMGGYGLEKAVVLRSDKTGEVVQLSNWWVLCFWGIFKPPHCCARTASLLMNSWPRLPRPKITH